MMSGSVKLLDVHRDARAALHSPALGSPTDDPRPGDAKLADSLVEIDPPAGFGLGLS